MNMYGTWLVPKPTGKARSELGCEHDGYEYTLRTAEAGKRRGRAKAGVRGARGRAGNRGAHDMESAQQRNR